MGGGFILAPARGEQMSSDNTSEAMYRYGKQTKGRGTG